MFEEFGRLAEIAGDNGIFLVTEYHPLKAIKFEELTELDDWLTRILRATAAGVYCTIIAGRCVDNPGEPGILIATFNRTTHYKPPITHAIFNAALNNLSMSRRIKEVDRFQITPGA